MSEHFKELVTTMEQLKETQRMQFDYFKHLTTLSTGSILIIIALLEKVFIDPEGIILSVLSIVVLAICLLGSLWAMPICGNIVLYTTGLRTIITVGDKDAEDRIKDANEFTKNISKSLKWIGILDNISRYSFLSGIILFLSFATLNVL